MNGAGPFAAAIFARGRDTPESRLYHFAGKALSCGELLDTASRLARALADRGVAPGTHVALSLPAGLDFVSAYAGVALAGGIPFALPADLPAATAARRAARGEPALLVTDSGRSEELAAASAGFGVQVEALERLLASQADAPRLSAPPAVDPEATFFLQFTSGTTGEARLARISHRAFASWRRLSPPGFDPRPGDVQVGWVPPWHIMGLVRYVLMPIICGIETHLLEPKVRYLGDWISVMSRVGCTRTSAPDFALRTALRLVGPEAIDLSRLRAIYCGGEAVRRSTITAFENRFGLPGVIRPGYGLAEATLTVSSALPGEPLSFDEAGNVACGRPFPGIELRLVDTGGREVATGGEGEIHVRGDTLFSGYFPASPGDTHLTGEGWLATGDWGRLGAEGELYVRGRRRNLLKHGGATFAPSEFEEAAESVAGILASAAIALRSAERPDAGPVIVAELDDPGAGERAAREVADAVRRAIGLLPGEVILLTAGSLPRTENGKLRHAELRRRIAAGELAGGALVFGRVDGWSE